MIVCIYIVEMVRPGTPQHRFHVWYRQREAEEKSGNPCRELPGNGAVERHVRVWKGKREDRDWDRMVRSKQADGWGLVSQRREFVKVEDAELVDKAG